MTTPQRPTSWQQWAAIMSIAATMGASGAWVLPQIQPAAARPDPFTGTDGKQLRAELLAKIEQVDTGGSRPITAITARCNSIEEQHRELKAHLRELEQQLSELRAQIWRQGKLGPRQNRNERPEALSRRIALYAETAQ